MSENIKRAIAALDRATVAAHEALNILDGAPADRPAVLLERGVDEPWDTPGPEWRFNSWAEAYAAMMGRVQRDESTPHLSHDPTRMYVYGPRGKRRYLILNASRSPTGEAPTRG
jgi:hypothetical protein